MTDNTKRLVYSIIQFLGNELQSTRLSSDATESLEVAIQCLESAYGIDPSNPNAVAALRVSRPLLEIFTDATQNDTIRWRAERLEEKDGPPRLKKDPVPVDMKSEEDEDDDEDDDDEEDDDGSVVGGSVLQRSKAGDNENGNVTCNRSSKKTWTLQRGCDNNSSSSSASNGQWSSHSHSDVMSPMPMPLDLSLMKGSTSEGDDGGSMQIHQLVRMIRKGSCQQCAKDGRWTKRGRPHESYFGCASCRVHLCRKRNCFQVFHTLHFKTWETTQQSQCS